MSWYDTKQSVGEVAVILEFGGMLRTPSLPSHPSPFWPGVVAPGRVLSMGQIEPNYVLTLNRNAWNRTVFTFKLSNYAKPNCLKWNCLWLLNSIVWKRIVFDIETVLTLNWIVWNRNALTFNCVWTKTILILNWIVWNRTVWLNWVAWNRNVFDN